MHGNDGEHRLAFLGLVKDYLEGESDEDDLPEALEKSIEEIEKELADYMAKRLGL